MFLTKWVQLALFSSVFAVGTANASLMRPTLQETQKEILVQKAQWIPKDSWVNHLTEAQTKRLLGAKNVPTPEVMFIAPDPVGGASALDWRNNGGKNYVSPMLNQANCGSCVAFAAVATLETQLNISAQIPGLDQRFSPQALFACGGGGCDSGWWPDSAADYMKKVGVPDEACAPYTMGSTGEDVACSTICKDSASRNLKIASFSQPTSFTVNMAALKAALAKGPLMTTLTVYSDFMQYGSGIYKHVTGKAEGGHAVSIVGYNDAERYFIIRNSWGETWGEKGFGRISYDDVSGIGRETWLLQLPSFAGYVSVVTPRDYTYVDGMYDMKASATYPNLQSLTFVFTDTYGRKAASLVGQGTGNEIIKQLDTRTLPDGKYEVAAEAAWGAKQISTSNHQLFYVVNSKPTMSVSFDGTNGTNLNLPLRDRIEMAIRAPSTPVPMSRLTFHYMGPDKVDHTKFTDVVLSEVTMGWRTNLTPNGTYDIWFTGEVTTATKSYKVESAHKTVVVKN